MGRAALAGMRASARSFGRVLHQLWLEVTGFTFLAMAAVGHGRYPRIWQVQSGHAADRGGWCWRFVLRFRSHGSE